MYICTIIIIVIMPLFYVFHPNSNADAILSTNETVMVMVLTHVYSFCNPYSQWDARFTKQPVTRP